MFSKTFAIILSGLLFTTLGLQTVRAQTSSAASVADEARAKVQKIGVGRDAQVEVKLRDNTKLKGYVSAAAADSFTVPDAKTGATREVAYADAAQVKKPGGISTRTWLILGGVATAAVIVGVTVLHPVLCDGGAGC